ncbi:hypothetical protein LMG29542_06754 [Paraburkholderia humisilvae]|uniref:Short-chain dehydrogenase/reductase SDR n=1 Tax=Paraburkholderia humisilvae TaxID=627669 RepID=A0A6J5EZD5_9BURK|nr:hypothetical protein LMG29542_06754 [Paraburkholderia humisilvae]
MKTVLIVGASRGIGWEFARQYRQAGWRVPGNEQETHPWCSIRIT